MMYVGKPHELLTKRELCTYTELGKLLIKTQLCTHKNISIICNRRTVSTKYISISNKIFMRT